MGFYIVKIDGHYRAAIDTEGKPNRYGTPKIYASRAAAQKWIDKHSYAGMSWKYIIKEVNSK